MAAIVPDDMFEALSDVNPDPLPLITPSTIVISFARVPPDVTLFLNSIFMI